MAIGRTKDESRAELERSIEALRRTGIPAARLSAGARARILREVRQSRRDSTVRAPLGSLFVPTARFAFSAALPLAALSIALVVVLTYPSGVARVPVESRAAATQIEATKLGAEVVFVIHNGGQTHSLREASDPLRFGQDLPVRTVEGRFRDRLDQNQGIVYYRID